MSNKKNIEEIIEKNVDKIFSSFKDHLLFLLKIKNFFTKLNLFQISGWILWIFIILSVIITYLFQMALINYEQNYLNEINSVNWNFKNPSASVNEISIESWLQTKPYWSPVNWFFSYDTFRYHNTPPPWENTQAVDFHPEDRINPTEVRTVISWRVVFRWYSWLRWNYTKSCSFAWSPTEWSAYWNIVVVLNDDGWATMYAHLDSIQQNITVWTTIWYGTLLGYMGNTGCSTWKHLHFEIRYNNDPARNKPSSIPTVSWLGNNGYYAVTEETTNLDYLTYLWKGDVSMGEDWLYHYKMVTPWNLQIWNLVKNEWSEPISTVSSIPSTNVDFLPVDWSLQEFNTNNFIVGYWSSEMHIWINANDSLLTHTTNSRYIRKVMGTWKCAWTWIWNNWLAWRLAWRSKDDGLCYNYSVWWSVFPWGAYPVNSFSVDNPDKPACWALGCDARQGDIWIKEEKFYCNMRWATHTYAHKKIIIQKIDDPSKFVVCSVEDYWPTASTGRIMGYSEEIDQFLNWGEWPYKIWIMTDQNSLDYWLYQLPSSITTTF